MISSVDDYLSDTFKVMYNKNNKRMFDGQA